MGSQFISPDAQILPRRPAWWETALRAVNPPLLRSGELPSLSAVGHNFLTGLSNDPVGMLVGGSAITTDKVWEMLNPEAAAFDAKAAKMFEHIQMGSGPFKNAPVEQLDMGKFLQRAGDTWEEQGTFSDHLKRIANIQLQDIKRAETEALGGKTLVELDAPRSSHSAGDEGAAPTLDIASSAPGQQLVAETAQEKAALASKAAERGIDLSMLDPRMVKAQEFLGPGLVPGKSMPGKMPPSTVNLGKKYGDVEVTGNVTTPNLRLVDIDPYRVVSKEPYKPFLREKGGTETRASSASDIGYSARRIRELKAELPDYLKMFSSGDAPPPSLNSLRKAFFALGPETRPRALELSGLKGEAQRGLEMFLGGQKPSEVKGVSKTDLLSAFINMFKELNK
jgi:hypothetical protein